ncbi:hypothetical protein BGX34_001312 [Mortierella sp. NVP85]|nr:hypothetical protein BGX34_001312 [Mortierella sp. NVP85]
MEQHIYSRKDAVDAMEHNYGELMHRLFVGGKVDTQESKAPLKQYHCDYLTYIKVKKAALVAGSQFLMAPPTFPSNSDPRTRSKMNIKFGCERVFLKLLEYNYKIEYRKGSSNTVAGVAKTAQSLHQHHHGSINHRRGRP